jgi:hypothetical protein
MSVKRSLSKAYAGDLTSKSFISRLRKEPNELRKKMLLLGYVTSQLEKKNQSIFLVVDRRSRPTQLDSFRQVTLMLQQAIQLQLRRS